MTKPSNKLSPGDRVAYTAKFLKNTGQFTGPAGARRGSFASYYTGDLARVHWDDFDAKFSADIYGEDYVADAIANGVLVHAANIAKVGSPKFAVNDI